MNEQLNPLTEGDGERMAEMLRSYLDAEQLGAQVAAMGAAFNRLRTAYHRALARRARRLSIGAYGAAVLAVLLGSGWGGLTLVAVGALCLAKADAHEDLADHSQEAE